MLSGEALETAVVHPGPHRSVDCVHRGDGAAFGSDDLALGPGGEGNDAITGAVVAATRRFHFGAGQAPPFVPPGRRTKKARSDERAFQTTKHQVNYSIRRPEIARLMTSSWI